MSRWQKACNGGRWANRIPYLKMRFCKTLVCVAYVTMILETWDFVFVPCWCLKGQLQCIFLKSRCNFGDQVSSAETSSMSQAPRYMKEIPARFCMFFGIRQFVLDPFKEIHMRFTALWIFRFFFGMVLLGTYHIYRFIYTYIIHVVYIYIGLSTCSMQGLRKSYQ